MTNSKIRTMLVYGATGKAGRLVVERALGQGWAVTAFVRNPDKLSEALRSKIAIVKGDLCDAGAVKAAVQACRPNAIIDASSAIPFGHAKGQPANNANRGLLTQATVDALEADGRLADCVLLIVGGQLLPEPGGTINSWSIAAMAWVLRAFIARKAWRDAERVVRWCFEGTPSAFRFVYARMGQMVEAPSRGTLCAEATLDNIQRGSVSYVDVAEALVKLASDEERRWERKALFFNYD
ncbi:NAD(P)-dependent oxidoreductase [Acidicapsa ligni]|uniref:NAD(P)-dependent oxidoreductase n=1 Tax=Acidicapsa ligni TaxID=542300 RepID=UPI0021E009AE|nr:SDR family oxidoreductase [Acidicapsa ligni]